ncbi:MAG: RNA pseudouridine synthase [Clostridia bacterium]|nr:RNA pseudouridine synthase [Clostridia bacterium]
MNLKILYEDNHIIVVVKPCKIPTQADKTGDMDMLSIVKEYLKVKYNKPGNVYLGLVHRLDRMVGGVMVFAKTSKAASRLSEYIREKNFKKKYYAILNGKLNNTSTERLENYLVKNEKSNMSRVTTSKDKNGKLAVLEYRILKNFKYLDKEYTLVDVDLFTGRHHQIRVQFSNIGHPLYGDVKYGENINKVGKNIGLWAYYLSFFHPTKDEYLEFNFKPIECKDIENTELYKLDKIWEVID